MDLSFISVPATIVVTAYMVLWFLLAIVNFCRRPSAPPPVTVATKVSIIVPARNEEAVILGLMSDLDAQTWKNCEVLLIAHNCTDGTPQLVRQWARQATKPVKVIELKTEESGKALALERGISESTGDVMAIFDADNRVPCDFIERGIRYIWAGYDGVQARILSKNPDESMLTSLQDAEFRVYPRIYCGAKHLMGFNSGVGGTGIILTRKALEEVKGFRNVLIEDYDILIRMTLAKKRIAYGHDLVTYDEKVQSWRALFRQRARWVAGYFQLWRLYSLKQKLRLFRYPVDLLYFFNPLCLLGLLCSYTLSLLHILDNSITFYSIPLPMWLAATVLLNLFFTVMLRQDKVSWRQALLMPYQVVVFGLHWFVAFFYGFAIRGWTDTKTPHSAKYT